jgi:hypothetical protein
MERIEVLDMMGELKPYGIRSAYDETLATAIKRKHEPQHFIGDLLKAEISEKHARSIKYQLSTAKLPLDKDVDDFAFKDTPVNENLVRGSRRWRSPSSTSSSSAEQGQAKPIWRSPSREAASAPARAAASSLPLISSIGSSLKAGQDVREGSPTI